jgi:hypothetical protein
MESSTSNEPALVTNTDFLNELVQAAPDGSCLWVCKFHGNPNSDDAKWGGLVYTPADHERALCDQWGDYNTYFSVAAVRQGPDGMFRRRKETFARMLALVVDDVELESLYSPPSWVLETSPGKTQAGYFLDAEDPDCGNEVLCTAVVKSMTMKGFIGGDISGNNSVRYVRLPQGTNQKPRTTGHWQHKLQVWNPGIRLTLDDACAAVGMDLDSVRKASYTAANGHAGQLIPDMPQDEKMREMARRVMEGNFHDPLNKIGASLIASGAHPAAVTNLLRGMMEAYPGPHDDRWKHRYNDIPRSVREAEAKYKPAPKPMLPTVVDAETGEIASPPSIFTHVGDLIGDIKPIQWLVENYLETDALSMVFGPSGAGKSFVVVDFACSIATGTPWHGMPVKQGPVFYIAGEGHNGLARRFAAWQKAHGVSLKDAPLYKSNKAVLMLDENAASEMSAEVERLAKIAGRPPALVVFDTLARNFGDGDENKQQDANKYIEHVDHYIRRRWQCNVMTVHHSGHDMDRARGSSSFKGAMDQELWVKGQMGNIEMQVTKMKDAEVPAPRLFKIDQIGLGLLDDCGVEIMGAYIKPDGNPLEFKVGRRKDGGELTAFDVAKAMYPAWPGLVPMAAILQVSDRSLSRIMTQMKSAGLASQKSRTGPWELTEKGLGQLELTGHVAVQNVVERLN